MLSNNEWDEWVNNEIKEEIKSYLKTNKNENATSPNLWDTVKAFPGGKFIAFQVYLKKQEKSQLNNLTQHLKELEKEQQTDLRVSRKKKIIKIKEENK